MNFYLPSSHTFFSFFGTALGIIKGNIHAPKLSVPTLQAERDEKIKLKLVALFSGGYNDNAPVIIEGFLIQISTFLSRSDHVKFKSHDKLAEKAVYFFLLPYLDKVIALLEPLETRPKDKILLVVLRDTFNALVNADSDFPLQTILNRKIKKILPKGIGADFKSDIDKRRIAREFSIKGINNSKYTEGLTKELKEAKEKKMRLFSDEYIAGVKVKYLAIQYSGLIIKSLYKLINNKTEKSLKPSENKMKLKHHQQIKKYLDKMVPNPNVITMEEAIDANHGAFLCQLVLGQDHYSKNFSYKYPMLLNLDYRLGIKYNFLLKIKLRNIDSTFHDYIRLFCEYSNSLFDCKQELNEIDDFLGCLFHDMNFYGQAIDKVTASILLIKIKTYLSNVFSIEITKEVTYACAINKIRIELDKDRLAYNIGIVLIGLLNISKSCNSPSHYSPILKAISVEFKAEVVSNVVRTLYGLESDSLKDNITIEHTHYNEPLAIEVSTPNNQLTSTLKEFNSITSIFHGYYVPYIDKLDNIEVIYKKYKSMGNADFIALASADLTKKIGWKLKQEVDELSKVYSPKVFGFNDISIYNLVYKCEEYLYLFNVKKAHHEWIDDIQFRKLLLTFSFPYQFGIDKNLAYYRKPSIYLNGDPHINIKQPSPLYTR